LVGCAIVAAIVSTATSLINAIGSNIAGDFKLSIPVQGITCLISVAAIFFAFYFDNIVDLLIQSYDLSVSCLFIPIIFALFKRQGNFFAALISILFGAFGFLLFRFYPIFLPKEIASILLSLIGYGIGELLPMRARRVEI
jgi:SSS family solute:Na+ symporter